MTLKWQRSVFWTWFIVWTILFFCFVAFDLQISSSFATIENWFTVGFDAFGQNIAIIVEYLCFFNIFNFWVSRSQRSAFSRIAWLWLLSVLGYYLLFYLLFLQGWLNGGFVWSSLYVKCELFVNVVLFVTVIIYCCLFIHSKVFYQTIVLEYLFFKTFDAFLYMIFIMITTSVMKVFFGRPRPREIIGTPWEQSHFYYAFQPYFEEFRSRSFPSGHTTSACTMLALLYFLPKKKSGEYIVAVNVFAILILCTAISRILIHAHWATDVTFAIFHCILWFIATPKITSRWRQSIGARRQAGVVYH